MKKTISILIPCYNESKTLSKTLPIMEGFFTEYYPEIELVFVNDGSKDDTESVLQVFQKMSSLNTQIISYTTNKGK
jgi:dolichol-phosphate mannosyltransferase